MKLIIVKLRKFGNAGITRVFVDDSTETFSFLLC